MYLSNYSWCQHVFIATPALLGEIRRTHLVLTDLVGDEDDFWLVDELEARLAMCQFTATHAYFTLSWCCSGKL